MTAANEGIGYLLISAGSSMQMGLAFAGLVVIGAMAMVMYELFAVIEKRTTGLGAPQRGRRVTAPPPAARANGLRRGATRAAQSAHPRRTADARIEPTDLQVVRCSSAPTGWRGARWTPATIRSAPCWSRPTTRPC